MKRLPFYSTAAIALTWRSAVAQSGSGQSNDDDSSSSFSPDKKCSIFLAPSSLHGNPGFGIYTSRDIAVGEPILSGPPGTPDGPTLPVIDASNLLKQTVNPLDKDHDRKMKLQQASRHWNYLFGHYWWGRGVPDHTAYESDTVLDFQITFGALPNHHCLLASLDNTNPPYDDTLTNRFNDPGAGAYSYHPGRIFYNAAYYHRHLHAGSEIFLDYGLCDREQANGIWYPEWSKFIPMKQDFEMATAAIVTQYNLLSEQYGGDDDDIPLDLPLDYDAPEPQDEEALSPQARSILPTTSGELIQAMQVAFDTDTERQKQQATTGGGIKLNANALQKHIAVEFGTNKRDPQWVQDNGMCIENLIPQKSTLPHAGQGAFAQHVIREGEIVVPVPLLHITDKAVLNMTTRIDNVDVEPKASGHQLLLNYCFSHKDTSLALCPASNAILINHCSTRLTGENSCGPKGPNAKYRWAGEDWDPRTKVWLNKTIDEMGEQLDRLLAMEIVATRDIQPGDEVFMDYGLEWEQAWLKHLEEWKPPTFGSEVSHAYDFEHKWLSYVSEGVVSQTTAREHGHFSVTKANQNTSAPLPYLVSGAVGHEENHPNIFTGCLFWATKQDVDDVYFKPSDYMEYNRMSADDIMERYSYDGRMFRKDSPEDTANDNYWPCQVLFQDNEDESNEITYTVRISEYPRAPGKLPWVESEVPRLLYYYPRASIKYFTKPYRSDAFLRGAFRHYIGIDDAMLPAQWRSLSPADEEERQQTDPQCMAEAGSCGTPN
mmetsp:Transcript_9625/g.23376  ORF Transcript_9625/g.23376 Transcript_9625/m.23376 type:complete len:770 (-) Transcript_9625:48-2357(-)